MKTFIIFLTFLFTIVLVSCGDKNPLSPLISSGELSAKINGDKFEAELAVQAVNVSGIFQLTGSNSTAKQLSIALTDYKGVGEYALGGPATSVHKGTGRWTKGLASTDTYITQVGLGNGTCKITKDDGKTVEGTFSFTAKNTQQDQITVTEGKFKAKY